MTRIFGGWMTEDGTARVMNMLCGAGHRAYFVGGCVRDALAGRDVVDIDITTDAEPQRVADLAQAAGLQSIPTGIEHGTVTVICGRPYEITTFRKDVETDGRRATVRFTRSLDEDAQRRDLTINGIYADQNGEVTDPVGGIEDLSAKRIRFIGDPNARIHEDHLRSLRYFRFYAWFGDPAQGPDKDALAAISANLPGLDTVSKERVGSEVRKLLSAPDPAPAVSTMAQSGVLNCLLPGADHRSLAVLVYVEKALDLAPSPMRRLAVITQDDPTTALRLSRADARAWSQVSQAARNGVSAGEAGYRLKATLGMDAIAAFYALTETDPQSDVRTAVLGGAEAVFPISAADLTHLNGRVLGEKLKQLESDWIASGFGATKADLLA